MIIDNPVTNEAEVISSQIKNILLNKHVFAYYKLSCAVRIAYGEGRKAELVMYQDKRQFKEKV